MSRSSLKNVARLIDTVSKEHPAEEMFLADLKRSIEIESNKDSRLPSQTLKPSSMNCIRGSYYQVIGIQPDSSEASFNMIGITNSGTDIHLRIQNYVIGMKENGMDCEWIDVAEYVQSRKLDYLEIRDNTGTETKLYDRRYNISFMCDGIIKYKNKYYILELKTETSNKWYSRSGVDKKHYHQAMSYSNSLQLDNVLFVYIDRDMLNMKAYMFNVTDEMRQEIVDYAESVAEYVKMQVVPPKPADVNCRYCIYLTQCRKDK